MIESFKKVTQTSSEDVKPSHLHRGLCVALPASVVEKELLYFMSSDYLTNTSCLVTNTEGSSHTSSAGRGGMLNLGLVKKAIFSLNVCTGRGSFWLCPLIFKTSLEAFLNLRSAASS